MIPYFEELTNPNDYKLIMGKSKCFEPCKKKINIEASIEYLNKYENLLKKLKDVSNLFKCINDEFVKKTLMRKYPINSNDSDKYFDAMNVFLELKEEFIQYEDEDKNINKLMSFELEYYIKMHIDILKFLIEIFPNNINNWTKIIELSNNALDELNKKNSIKFQKSNKQNYIELPNAWYITAYNDLYNSNGKDGHKQTNLIYPFCKIKQSILNGNVIRQGYSNELLKAKYKLLEKGYIKESEFTHWMNLIYYLPSIDNNPRYSQRKSYNKNIIKIVAGVISAHASLYKFFEDLCIYTENPKEEMEKILDLTNGNLEDILIKCCGFSKMGVSGIKTICTAKQNSYKEFKEYIFKGWKIDVINPIVIDKEYKTVKEITINKKEDELFH